jgi:hypothetical protein
LFHILFDKFNYLGSSGESNKDVPIIVTTGSKTNITGNCPSRSNSVDICLTTPAIGGGIETLETDDADDREIKVVGKKVNYYNYPDFQAIQETIQVESELSALVNYVRSMGKFTTFQDAKGRLDLKNLYICFADRNMSSECFSLQETKALELLKQFPTQFVSHNKRQITRIYPRGGRVDSSNYLPQVND